jgi:hypothetical protein
MREALLIGLLTLGVATPVLVHAQPVPPADASGNGAHAPPSASAWMIRPGQWIAVGAGVVAGAVAMEVLVPTRLIYVLGGVAGGYFADVWYGGRRVEIRSVP